MTAHTFPTEAAAVAYVRTLPWAAEIVWEQVAGGPVVLRVSL